MPQLIWDPLDVLTVLAVEPVVDEDGIAHDYFRETPPLWLRLTAWQYESAVGFRVGLCGSDTPMLSLVAFVRDRVVRREADDEEWLEIRDVVLAPDRYSYLELGDVFDRKRRPEFHNLRIWVAPAIYIEFDR